MKPCDSWLKTSANPPPEAKGGGGAEAVVIRRVVVLVPGHELVEPTPQEIGEDHVHS
jgi:hypothetical protein